MKSMMKIIRRYCITAGFIIFTMILANGAALLYWGYKEAMESGETVGVRASMEDISSELSVENKRASMSDRGITALSEETEFQWAMVLNPNGEIIWSWQLPEEIPRRYSLSDVASFSRWYLCDYPVRVWSKGENLFVFAWPKEMFTKYMWEFRTSEISKLPFYIKYGIFLNIFVIILFILVLGWRFYKALKPVGEGIDRLSRQEPVQMREKGMASELAGKLNRTSSILQKQKEKLEQRDRARTEWIAGVSHDIRTPLALIMGYSDELSREKGLGEEEKKKAEMICRQSLVIRQLIQDLNLTSKLAYHAQPLHKTEFSPAILLRECVAEFYNEGMEQNYEIEAAVTEEGERARITGDEGLWKRALRNLLGNSIRHNPSGCGIKATLKIQDGSVCYEIRDSGPGIPGKIADILEGKESENKENAHIMGLRIAEQIAAAHGGELQFIRRENGSCDIRLVMGKKE